MKQEHRLLPLVAALAAMIGFPGTLAALEQPPQGLSSTDWASIQTAFNEARNAVVSNNTGGLASRNPGQHWQATFDGIGFTTTPDSADWSWGLALEGYGFESAITDQSFRKPSVSFHRNKVYYQWDQTLSEWFINDTNGLEQGWTLQQRPTGASTGPLYLKLVIRGTLVPQAGEDGTSLSFLKHNGDLALTYTGLKAWDADGKHLSASFKSTDAQHFQIAVDEEHARYPITIDPTAQNAYLKASNTGSTDGFGLSVAVSGDTVVIGAPQEDSGSNGVNGNQSNNNSTGSGAAYVFVRNGGTWSQQAYLKASNTGATDTFGTSVDVSESGNVIIVGAPFEDSGATGINGNENDNSKPNSGAAYIFAREGTSWSQQAYLKASNSGLSDNFGQSVAIHANSAVVGAPAEDSNSTGINGDQGNNLIPNAGAVYAFKRTGNNWTQQAYIKASNTGPDLFGHSVGISEGIIVVGAPFEASNATGVDGNGADNTAPISGAAYIFKLVDNTWSQDSYLKASNTGSNDLFGSSVAVAGDTVVVGSQNEDSSSSVVDGDGLNNDSQNAGAAYVFTETDGDWSQQAYLKASNSEANDSFGFSVAVSGNTVVVSAPAEDSDAVGVDGNQESNLALTSGAAYLFKRKDGEWEQNNYIKASNTNANDLFGFSVSISGNTILIGATGEDSSATGVNKSQSSNSAPGSGASYIFLTPTAKPEIVVRNPFGNSIRDGFYTRKFGRVRVGNQSSPSIFTIRNIGDADLSELSLRITGDDKRSFIASGLNQSTLAPGESTTFRVRFAPKETGRQNAELRIRSNDADEDPFNIGLRGSGRRR
jgi:trimeric autotransporter adhesin